jgi:hypothetical protein
LIRKLTTVLLHLLRLVKLQSFALISLVVGAYFIGVSQPGRELWADLLLRPTFKGAALTLLGGILWVLSLAWSSSRANAAYESSRRPAGGPALHGDLMGPLSRQSFMRASRFVPSVLACTAAFALLMGMVGFEAKSESHRLEQVGIMIRVWALIGTTGAVYLLDAWRLEGERARALRRWLLIQAVVAVVLVVIMNVENNLLGVYSVSAAVLILYLLRTRLGATRRVVAALLLARIALILAVIVLSSTQVECLISAEGSSDDRHWDVMTNHNAQTCRDLWDKGKLAPSSLLMSYLLFVTVAILFVLLEWLGIWTWKRFASRRTAHKARVKAAPAARLLLDAAVAIIPVALGCVAFGVWPVQIAAEVGTLPLVLFALAAWTTFLTWLFIEVPVALGVGPWPLALPLWLLLVSPWTDNHRMREATESPPKVVALVPSPSDECAGSPHPLLCERYLAWDRQRAARFRSEPVYLIVSSGGGVRAAYWTALLLAKMEDGTCGHFSRSTFAISGVSGGSVGATVFLAAALHVRPTWPAGVPCTGSSKVTTELVERVFGNDLMAPLVGAMLFPDAAQRFLPAWSAWGGRGRVFEAALEDAWRVSAGTDTLARPFLSMYSQEQDAVPLLLLASTRVEDGYRVISSPVDPQDPLAYWLQDPSHALAGLRLSTAAHNSARFPFVSPPGRVETARGELLMRIVDGGYFENSSASTGRIALRAILPPSKLTGRTVSVLMIENDPTADIRKVCRDANETWTPASAKLLSEREPSSFAFELNAVVQTLVNTRSARSPWHQSEMEELTCNSSEVSVLRMLLKDPDKYRYSPPEPAMSWYLSEQTKEDMRRRSDEEVAQALARHLMPPTLSPSVPRAILPAIAEGERASGK